MNCRFCASSLNDVFLDLGTLPLSNSFLKSKTQKDQFYPLCVFVCKHCLFVQLDEFVRPKDIFTDYAYFSSYSQTWLDHAKEYCSMITKRFDLIEQSHIVEIASNDGYLLQYFKNFDVLGIEPAENVAKVARQKGIPTITKFFDTKLAKELSKADLIIGNNVLAHVPNLNDFINGLKILLKPNGIITMEFPHLLQLIRNNQFDTIYHEHFSYFSFLVVQKIFAFHGLIIFDVNELSTHGGSLRIYAKHEQNNKLQINDNVSKLISKEIAFGLDKLETYINFQKNIEMLKEQIKMFFMIIKQDPEQFTGFGSPVIETKNIIGYGAAAKGNTLLNYCHIGENILDYVVDLNPNKQGLYLPGSHIPIKNPSEIKRTKPNYILILPWNIKEEIMKQLNFIKAWGGKFITVIPQIEIHELSTHGGS